MKQGERDLVEGMCLLKRHLQGEGSWKKNQQKKREEKERKRKEEKMRQIEFEKEIREIRQVVEQMRKNMEELDKIIEMRQQSWHLTIKKRVSSPIKKIVQRRKQARTTVGDDDEDLWTTYAAIEKEWNRKVAVGQAKQAEMMIEENKPMKDAAMTNQEDVETTCMKLDLILVEDDIELVTKTNLLKVKDELILEDQSWSQRYDPNKEARLKEEQKMGKVRTKGEEIISTPKGRKSKEGVYVVLVEIVNKGKPKVKMKPKVKRQIIERIKEGIQK
ncbi:uncharacterized protein LOC131075046 [Cryptomeria japonica]|uniref:uncharacterized protein LOC131075046 n=1 Tax=Cryptomeria japonica TaxID=3369 RepID=UPI0027DA3A60|nr:uncharacterized protein LOC131075046 [Cryptomeria japonica]